MFGEFLDAHPLEKLMERVPVCPFPASCDRAAWEALAEEDRADILALYAHYSQIPYPMLTATQFLAFARSGCRTAYETPYFERRRKLCASILAYCVTQSGQALDDVVDGLWCICEESTWVISAHNVNPHPGAPKPADYPLPDIRKEYIDLFSAQTAMILSLALHLLGEPLDGVTPLIRRRVESELSRRVIAPFMTHDDFWWMGFIRKDLCNWTPWIISNILAAASLQMKDLSMLRELTDRACRMLDRWLDCMPEDGGCDEGAAYWNMAGGALLDCLMWLDDATEGRMTFWNVPKIRNILAFPCKAQLENGWYVNFADCDARPVICGERLQAAGERLGDPVMIASGSALRGTVSGQIADVPHFSRMLCRLFHPAAQDGKLERTQRDVWLPNLALRVVERGGMILCAKGGHNGESHNHNDVGSFMLYADGEPEIIDLGNMIYTGKTFSDKRYTLMNTRSMNHNVPLIGGREQQPGAQYAAKDVQRLNDGLALDMAGAYGANEILCAARSMELGQGMILHDRIGLADEESAAWVFMLRSRPEKTADGLRFGKLRMRWNAALDLQITEIPVTDARMAKSFPGSVWRIQMDAAPAVRHDVTFVIERNELHE